MTMELIPAVSELLAAQDATLARLRAAKGEIGRFAVEELSRLRAWASVVSAAARAAKAQEIADEAAETRLRAERRLAQLVASDYELPGLGAPHSQVQHWRLLAKIPDPVLDEVVTELRRRGTNLTAQSVVRHAERKVLKSARSGILRCLWSDRYFVDEKTINSLEIRYEARKLLARPHATLEAAQEALRGAIKLKNADKEKKQIRLDFLHVEARQFAATLQTVRDGLGPGPAADAVGRATLKQAEVAEALFDAWRETQIALGAAA